MHSLFSHAPEPPNQSATETPAWEDIQAAVTVPVSAEEALDAFTEYTHLWWPAKQLRASGHISIDRDGILEEGMTGDSYLWAELTSVRAESPYTLGFSFLHDSIGTSATRLTIEFAAQTLPQHDAGRVIADEPVQGALEGRIAGEARITLTHGSWLEGTQGLAQREQAPNWAEILDSFARFMGSKS